MSRYERPGGADPAAHPNPDRLALDLVSPAGEKDPSVAEHLAACEACRREVAELRDLLRLVEDAPAPPRDARYGAQVWWRLRPRLDANRPLARRDGRAGWLASRRWALAATAAALVLVAFLAGRHWPVPDAPISAGARERILLVAVGEHIDRAQRALVDLANAGRAGAAGEAGASHDLSGDVADAQQRAEDLVAANRIYRQAAAGAGDRVMTALLDDLERVLLDVAHRPAAPAGQDLERLREEIRSSGILFKLRVAGAQVRERAKAAPSAPNGPARGSV